MTTTFQKFLKHAYASSGLGREEFANKILVSKGTLGNYLSGRTSPSFDEGCRIVQATDHFDVNIQFKTPDDEFFDTHEG